VVYSKLLYWLAVGAGVFLAARPVLGTTTITNTRAEISFMASLWEADSIQISSLANSQYPQFSNNWQFIFPHANLAADGDIHIDMGVNSSGYGSTNNNTGNSPIIAEVVNATSGQLSHLQSLNRAQAKSAGIFRYYTEHTAERHFELHPAIGIATWNGSSFVLNNFYRTNIASVADGTNHATSTLTNLLNGSQTVTATVAADNVRVAFDYPSPSVNYVQYDGLTTSGLTNDGVSPYFLFRPNLVPSVVVRCRIVTNTVAASVAATVVSNQTITVNALTRTDMLAVSNRIAQLSANQSALFARPIELITLGLTTSAQGPSITGQPQGQTVNPGQDATFTVTAIGSPPLSYQWRSNGIAVAGATGSSLSLTNVQASDAANYSAVVTNAFGSATSSNAPLLVVAGLIAQWNFNSTPPDANVNTGTTNSSVGSGVASAVGTSPAFFTGSGNDPASGGSDNSGWSTTSYPPAGTGNKTAGAMFTASSLGFRNLALSWDQRVSPTASKYFRLQYTTNGVDFVDSANVITMLTTNVFESKTNNLASLAGIENNPNFAFRIVSEFESSAIGTTNTNYVTATGSGYTVNGTVRFDMMTLYGTALPVVTAQPSSLVAVAGQDVDFDVGAAGATPLAYQWRFAGTNIGGATGTTLTLTNVAVNQSGPYDVVVANSVGSVTSSMAALTVYPTAAATLSAPGYGSGQFQLNVTGVPDFAYAIQASTNLLDWISLETNASPFTTIDTNAAALPRRFYRALYLPGLGPD
jgi:hypothetical protein